jgi:hypothetical protein
MSTLIAGATATRVAVKSYRAQLPVIVPVTERQHHNGRNQVPNPFALYGEFKPDPDDNMVLLEPDQLNTVVMPCGRAA